MAKRPIDSFVKYFLDVKPYHTKILEVVERYKFQEYLDVDLTEKLLFNEAFSNTPLCKGVGYGLDFDDDCGYSALSCCDLFDCLGGYGLIFDNSDLLVSAPIDSYDDTLATITLDGDYRYDTYFQIHSTVGNNTIRILGNIIELIENHSLFVISPKNVYNVIETVYDGFYVQGNVQNQFNNINEFSVINSVVNDDRYSTVEAVYDPQFDRTFIKIFLPDLTTSDDSDIKELDVNSLGQIVINSETKNNGGYQRTDYYFDGQYTNIILHEDTLLKLVDESRHGSVVIRTGYIPDRRVWLNDGTLIFEDMPEAKILNTTYDVDTDKTTILLEIASTEDGPVLDFSLLQTVDLRGYYFGAGFDGFKECTTPKPSHLYASFSEYVVMTVTMYE